MMFAYGFMCVILLKAEANMMLSVSFNQQKGAKQCFAPFGFKGISRWGGGLAYLIFPITAPAMVFF